MSEVSWKQLKLQRSSYFPGQNRISSSSAETLTKVPWKPPFTCSPSPPIHCLLPAEASAIPSGKGTSGQVLGAASALPAVTTGGAARPFPERIALGGALERRLSHFTGEGLERYRLLDFMRCLWHWEGACYIVP